jgi:hypothetical protein
MKKIGIGCDNYKLDKFKEVLNQKGFTDYTISRLTPYTSFIRINLPDDQVMEIKKVCDIVETHFKRKN